MNKPQSDVLEAFKSLFRVDDVEDDGSGFVKPKNYDQCRYLSANEYNTFIEALTSAPIK